MTSLNTATRRSDQLHQQLHQAQPPLLLVQVPLAVLLLVAVAVVVEVVVAVAVALRPGTKD